MNKTIVIIILLLAAGCLFASDQIVETKVTKVKVFLRGAEITHSASVNYSAGQNEILLKEV